MKDTNDFKIAYRSKRERDDFNPESVVIDATRSDFKVGEVFVAASKSERDHGRASGTELAPKYPLSSAAYPVHTARLLLLSSLSLLLSSHRTVISIKLR